MAIDGDPREALRLRGMRDGAASEVVVISPDDDGQDEPDAGGES